MHVKAKGSQFIAGEIATPPSRCRRRITPSGIREDLDQAQGVAVSPGIQAAARCLEG